MTKLEQIEKSISELEPEEFRAFSEWFDALQAQRWDVQFETDAISDALDRLADQALADVRAGRSRRL